MILSLSFIINFYEMSLGNLIKLASEHKHLLIMWLSAHTGFLYVVTTLIQDDCFYKDICKANVH